MPKATLAWRMPCCASSLRSCPFHAGSATSPTQSAAQIRRRAGAFRHRRAIHRGHARAEVDRERLADDLAANWELLAEPIQTVMRRYAVPEAYEQLKALTSGRRIDGPAIAKFVDGLPIPDAEKARLKALTPATYIGLAARLARDV